MSNTGRCSECGYMTECADSSADQACPKCGASASTEAEVYEAEVISLDKTAIVTSAPEEALLIQDDDLVDDSDVRSSPMINADNPMAFLKSLEPPPVKGRRRCPNCRHYIQPAAIRCRHCHVDLESWKTTEPLATALTRDLSISERQLMRSYRGGTKLIIGYSIAMIFVALLFAFAYSLDFSDNPRTSDYATGLSLLFAICWATSACFCFTNSINAIRAVGLLCALDLIWMSMDLNPIGLLASGIMLWVVVVTTSKSKALRQRGIVLSLTGQPVALVSE